MEYQPEKIGVPAMASTPTSIVRAVIGIFAIEPAHLPHVLLVMAAVDDAAGAEEQQRLEEGVREQVQQARDPAADAEREHHEAELADRRIGQHLLDVGGDDGDGRGDEQRDARRCRR